MTKTIFIIFAYFIIDAIVVEVKANKQLKRRKRDENSILVYG